MDSLDKSTVLMLESTQVNIAVNGKSSVKRKPTESLGHRL